MLYNLEYILNDIETSILQKKPFSIARLGDGDLKLLVSVQANLPNPWKFKQQGIPLQQAGWIRNIYRNSCNNANYVSSFDLYFDGSMWPRPMSSGMRKKIRGWKQIYINNGIVNENHCSPEIGFLFFLDEPRNLFSILKDKRICLITCFNNVEMKLKNLGYNVNSLIIPGRNQNQFRMYHKNIKRIIRRTKNYDVFLVGAGSLGRGYSNCIKNHGGIAIDIGQVFDAWAGCLVAKRIKKFVRMTNSLTFQLTSNSISFRKNF
jgi:hypothetical protein